MKIDTTEMKVNTKVLLLLLLTLLITSCNTDAETIVYTNLYNQKAEAVLQFRSDGVIVGHVVKSATYCKETDQYFCISSKAFKFAVPKDMSRKRWRYDGAEYKTIFDREEWILGKYMKYWVVNQTLDGQEIEYIYSKEYGIVSIKIEGSQVILSSPRGVLAAKGERTRHKLDQN